MLVRNELKIYFEAAAVLLYTRVCRQKSINSYISDIELEDYHSAK